MFMNATVISIEPRGLLVRDMETGEEFFVNFGNTAAFSPGDTVRITYTGTMTPSIPPQISATAIERTTTVPQPPPTYSEIRRAQILQIRRNVLIVRNPLNSQQVTVNYQYAHHFCIGQKVNIQYETAFLNGGYTVNATDIIPLC